MVTDFVESRGGGFTCFILNKPLRPAQNRTLTTTTTTNTIIIIIFTTTTTTTTTNNRYSGDQFENVAAVRRKHPHTLLIATEATEGGDANFSSSPSWTMGEHYSRDIMGDFNAGTRSIPVCLSVRLLTIYIFLIIWIRSERATMSC